MAIKGLTDKVAAFPTIGELRKGEAKPENGNRPGKDLTYFRFTSEDKLAQEMFAGAYPDQDALRNINVFLPYKSADENIDCWIEKWVAGGLVYRSDGETLVLWRTDKGGYSTEPKPDPYQALDTNGKRKDGGSQVGRMSVIIPELGRFATVTILTTSKHDIINLTRQLKSYEALRSDLRGIPFVIKRRPHKISTPGQNGERARREKWLLSIETQPQWTIAQLGAMERAALPAGEIIEDDPVYPTIELQPNISNPFEDTPEPTPQPEPQPTNGSKGNDQPKSQAPTNGDLPRNLQDLLKVINRRVQVPYDNVYHLQGGIKKELGSDWSVPKANETRAWQAAYNAAYKHAEAKTQPAQAEPAKEPTSELDEYSPREGEPVQEEIEF